MGRAGKLPSQTCATTAAESMLPTIDGSERGKVGNVRTPTGLRQSGPVAHLARTGYDEGRIHQRLNQMLPITDSRELRRRRIKLGLTQAQAGELIGVDQGQISRIETGKAGETLTNILYMALDALERDRQGKEWVEADAFWHSAWPSPNREQIVMRIEQVARELMDTSLRGAGFADRLRACLPAQSRDIAGHDE